MYVRISDSSGYRTKNGGFSRYATIAIPTDNPATAQEKLNAVTGLPEGIKRVADIRYPTIAELVVEEERIRQRRLLAERMQWASPQ